MDLPNRHSIRLKGYDYSLAGAYFITICTDKRQQILGHISVGVDPRVNPQPYMEFNDIGKMIDEWWLKIPEKFPNVDLCFYQIMPNHIHGIILINGQTHGSAPTIGTIIQWFKTMSTNNYINNVKHLKWKPFDKRIWQRNYYEHIIRNDKDLNIIWEYVVNNPLMWDRDRNNPDAKGDLIPF